MISSLWRLVQPGARRRFLWLTVLVSLGGLVELAGIATVAEMMSLIASGGQTLSRGLIGLSLEFAQAATINQRLSVGLGVTLAVLGLAHSFTALCAYLRCQFVWIQEKEISTRIFSSILQRPYLWFLQKNTADLVHLLMSGQFTQRVLSSALAAVSQLSVATTLALALFIADPEVALVGGLVVAIAYTGVRLGTRTLLQEKGGLAHSAERERNKTAREALTSIRFVKTTGKGRFFVQRFAELSETSSKGMVYHGIYVEVVRAFLEWVAYGGIMGLAVYLLLHTRNLTELLPSLTLYTMASYRMIPAIHELFGLWSLTRFDRGYLEQVNDFMASPTLEQSVPQERLDPSEESSALLSLEKVSFRYPGSEREILRGVSLSVGRREWVGIVGTTGAGKSTLLDLLSGLCEPSSGQVKIGHQALEPRFAADWQSRLGVVPQEVILLDDTLQKNVAFGIPEEEIDAAKIQAVCAAAGLGSLLQTLDHGYQTRLGERGVRLSGGERQRVGLARALYQEPALLLLDEATSALDQATEARIVATLRELAASCTLVTVAHRLSSVRPCDRILVLDAGQIVGEGTYDELLRKSSAFQELALLAG